ncbi:MAG: hypothetical protein Kow00124_24200 [Anaerolineae bacterium]
MTWREAFSALAAIDVAGVTTSYDLDEVPAVLAGADLPALLPSFPLETSRMGERGEEFAALTYDGGVWTAALVVDHLLFWRPAGAGAALNEALPELIDALDAYLEALGADGTLGGVLSQPLTITRVQPGLLTHAGVSYLGVRFRQRWVRVIEAGSA